MIALTIGVIFSQLGQWQIPIPTQADIGDNLGDVEALLTGTQQQNTMLFIIWQNSRVLLLSFILSLISFGVASLLIPPATFTILGYIVGLLLTKGYSLTFILGAILTHGIIEIPVIIIATGASLALGAAITRPPQGETVGHTWIVYLGTALKLTLGIIIPGLVIAAFIEAFITPHVILTALGG